MFLGKWDFLTCRRGRESGFDHRSFDHVLARMAAARQQLTIQAVDHGLRCAGLVAGISNREIESTALVWITFDEARRPPRNGV